MLSKIREYKMLNFKNNFKNTICLVVAFLFLVSNISYADALRAPMQGAQRAAKSLRLGLFSRITDYFNKNGLDGLKSVDVKFKVVNTIAGFKYNDRVSDRKTFLYEVSPNIDILDIYLLIENIESQVISWRLCSTDNWRTNHAVKLRKYVLNGQEFQESVANALFELVEELAVIAGKRDISFDRNDASRELYDSYSGSSLEVYCGDYPWFNIVDGALLSHTEHPGWWFIFFGKGNTKAEIAEKLCKAAGIPEDIYRSVADKKEKRYKLIVQRAVELADAAIPILTGLRDVSIDAGQMLYYPNGRGSYIGWVDLGNIPDALFYLERSSEEIVIKKGSTYTYDQIKRLACVPGARDEAYLEIRQELIAHLIRGLARQGDVIISPGSERKIYLVYKRGKRIDVFQALEDIRTNIHSEVSFRSNKNMEEVRMLLISEIVARSYPNRKKIYEQGRDFAGIAHLFDDLRSSGGGL